ncbi:GNAT family N-acetyltransferase [Amylolactobacillus amylophilus]|uniref:GNAT family N-acetyltransferase n=1 Tax=Amylolactobacillus amylophilus TaxID=1603 RepID=UPI000A8F7E51|nr:GNAT family N-acetyltransferase [Amylolactobacillus amylophilus]
MIRTATEQDFPAIFPILQQIFDEMELKSIAAIDDSAFYHLLEEGWHTPGYRYSLGRTLVSERDGEVAGMITSYRAEDEPLIDAPLEQYYSEVGLPRETKIFTDREARPGEWYIDSLAVAPQFQGHGIGGQLLDAMPDLAAQNGYKKN